MQYTYREVVGAVLRCNAVIDSGLSEIESNKHEYPVSMSLTYAVSAVTTSTVRLGM